MPQLWSRLAYAHLWNIIFTYVSLWYLMPWIHIPDVIRLIFGEPVIHAIDYIDLPVNPMGGGLKLASCPSYCCVKDHLLREIWHSSWIVGSELSIQIYPYSTFFFLFLLWHFLFLWDECLTIILNLNPNCSWKCLYAFLLYDEWLWFC